MKLKLLTIFALLCFQNTFASNTCDKVGRATTTDQKNMATAIALQYLGLDQNDVLKMKVSDYVSWKSIQVMCMADIIHFAKIEVENRDGEGRRCVTTVDLHTKDYFVAQIEFNREYKARNVKTNCFDESTEQAEQRNRCDAMAKCPTRRDGLLMRDLYDNCECKYLDDMIDFTNVQGAYEDFYNPKKPFKKPEGLESPFN